MAKLWQKIKWHLFSGHDVVFTSLHRMQTQSSDENSVCPSVKRVVCDKMEERSVHMFIQYERTFVFREEEWLMGRPLLRKISGQPARVGAKSPILSRYSLIAPQPLHLVQLTLIESRLHAFQ